MGGLDGNRVKDPGSGPSPWQTKGEKPQELSHGSSEHSVSQDQRNPVGMLHLKLQDRMSSYLVSG